ncbi:hypothetical protein ACQ4PT_015634 [Festuca glaucescens]
MGGCFSGDVRGGKEAVGGGGSGMGRGPAAAGHGGANEAVDHFFQGHGLRGLYTPLELSFSAAKLRNMDALSKSDPMLVIYAKKDGRLEEIGRTEVILNSLEPLWITKAMINYQFEMVQPLVFKVYDIDTKYHNTPVKMLNLAQQDFLGEACCNLSEIVTKFNHSLTLNLRSGSGHALLSTMTVHAEETSSSRMAVEMTFHCQNLENKDTFSLSDPFLRVSRLSENSAAILYDNPLLVECFDFDDSGNHELIGSLQTTISQLENLYNSKTGANFYSNKGQKKMKGQLFLNKFHEKVQHTFLDYISSGFELNFMVAVDFTASNGDPRTPQSLHYIDPSGRPNSYQQVRSCLTCLRYSLRLKAFLLNHLMYQAILGVALAGPTLFGPVVTKAAEIANHAVQYSNNKYFVLLIITDGVITDVQETKDAIVRASDLPLSILIVGVGTADFTQMRCGTVTVVQSLLEELPGQSLEYMRTRDIKPLPPSTPRRPLILLLLPSCEAAPRSTGSS